MSAPSLQRRSSNRPKLLLALVVLLALGGASYYLLVWREDVACVRAQAEADLLEAELAKGRAYLAGRPDDKLSLAEIHEAAATLQKRVPLGRKDIAVAQYCQLRAADAGITDFKYEVVGGMALPDEKPATKSAPEERLVVQPGQLKSQLISMEFSTRYLGLLKLEKALSEAPWLLELVKVDLRHDAAGPDVSAHLTVRYLYQ